MIASCSTDRDGIVCPTSPSPCWCLKWLGLPRVLYILCFQFLCGSRDLKVTGAVTEWRKDEHTKTLHLAESLIEKPQDPGSLVCLVYRVEQEKKGYCLQLNKEAGLANPSRVSLWGAATGCRNPTWGSCGWYSVFTLSIPVCRKGKALPYSYVSEALGSLKWLSSC